MTRNLARRSVAKEQKPSMSVIEGAAVGETGGRVHAFMAEAVNHTAIRACEPVRVHQAAARDLGHQKQAKLLGPNRRHYLHLHLSIPL